jgi:hypothetical protein
MYTCLLVEESPRTLVFGDIAVDRSTVARITNQVTDFTMSWQDRGGSTSFYGGTFGSFPNAATWGANNTGLLRVDIVPLGASFTRAQMQTAAKTFFLYPNPSASPVVTLNYATQATGSIVAGNCTNTRTYYCQVRITGVPASPNLYVRMRSVYNNVSVQMSDAQTGATLSGFSGVQRLIDSTGKDQDVLRRIQVRAPFSSTPITPDFAIESADSICKLIRFNGTAVTDECGVLP